MKKIIICVLDFSGIKKYITTLLFVHYIYIILCIILLLWCELFYLYEFSGSYYLLENLIIITILHDLFTEFEHNKTIELELWYMTCNWSTSTSFSIRTHWIKRRLESDIKLYLKFKFKKKINLNQNHFKCLRNFYCGIRANLLQYYVRHLVYELNYPSNLYTLLNSYLTSALTLTLKVHLKWLNFKSTLAILLRALSWMFLREHF